MKTVILTIIFGVILAATTFAQESNTVFDKIEALSSQPLKAGYIAFDVSSSVQNQLSDEHKSKVLAWADARLQKPGDQIFFSFVNDQSAGRMNVISGMGIEGSLPNTRDKRELLRYLQSMKQQKILILRKVKKLLNHQPTKSQTEIIETFGAIGRHISMDKEQYEADLLLISDLFQYSEGSRANEIIKNVSFDRVQDRAKKDAQIIQNRFLIPSDCFQKFHRVEFWVTGKVNNSTPVYSIMPEYLLEVLKAFGYSKEENFHVHADKF